MNYLKTAEFDISLLTSEEITKKEIKEFLSLVYNKGPENIINPRTKTNHTGEQADIYLVQHVLEKGFKYQIPLKRNLTEDELKVIVLAWTKTFNKDFDIEATSPILNKKELSKFEEIDVDEGYEMLAFDTENNIKHQRWVESQINDGWRYGIQFSDKSKTSPLLRPWEQLPKKHQDYCINKLNILKENLNEIFITKGDAGKGYIIPNEKINTKFPIVGKLQNEISIGLDDRDPYNINIVLYYKTKSIGIAVLEKDKNQYQIKLIKINPKYQGQNLGYELYKFLILKLNYTIKSDDIQTKISSHIWSKLWKTSGILVYGNMHNKYFQVELNDLGQLEGKHDIYGMSNAARNQIYDSLDTYYSLIDDMCKQKEITKKERNELKNNYYDASIDEIAKNGEVDCNAYLIATKDNIKNEL